MKGYINTEILGVTVVILIALLLYGISEKRSIDTKYNIGAMIAIIIGLNIYSYYDAVKNTQRFKDNKELRCTNHSRISNTTYLVSKDERWEIYESYFKKNSLLIEAFKCKEK